MCDLGIICVWPQVEHQVLPLQTFAHYAATSNTSLVLWGRGLVLDRSVEKLYHTSSWQLGSAMTVWLQFPIVSQPLLCLQAPLSDDVLPWLEEVALNEQGHALFTRHAGSSLPCPAIDFDEGEPGCSPASLCCLLSWQELCLE